ncbi:MAG: ABC transporter permease [Bryobacterales bacterium]|nr:ABC transporter permease [Bryobacteraceae bacterium]MDW8130147.1 ABC transporter permease [Bryobacterales bacterium]
MKLALRDPVVELEEATRVVRVELTVENASRQTWQPAEGFALGFQIFDPDTDILIVDGKRVPFEEELTAGVRRTVRLEIPLPAEPGRYRIFVSPLQENVCWFYERGWPFLLIEAEVAGGNARLLRSRLATRSALRRERLLRAVGRGFTYPVLSIWRNRKLIRAMVRRDIRGRYRGSFMGLYWTVLNPLLLMLTYFFVFGIVLRARLGADPSRTGFALYFLAGMLPWLPFSEATGRAPWVILEHRNFVKKLVFPVETLPVNLVVAGLVTEAFALGLFLVALLVLRGAVPATALWLPVLVVPQVLFTMGLCWFLAALGVYLRDLGQVIGFILTLWFFLTPICYPAESLPREALPVLSKNPLFVLVEGYRTVLLDRAAPSWGPVWKLWSVSLVVFFGGYAWFYKLRKNFADVI